MSDPDRADRCVIAADLHLDGAAASRERFGCLLDFARSAGAPLFILGDLFHYWFGRGHLDHPMYREELRLLARASDQGAEVFVIPGNRDFLLDETFSRSTGVGVGGDRLALQVAEHHVHLSHGDLFCTSDLAYQGMRRVVRSSPVRFLAHHMPRTWVNRWASGLREHSERVVAEKSAEILEPDLQEVAGLFQAGHDVVVCGHFHRRIWWTGREGFEGLFVVVEPFDERGYVLCHGEQGWQERFV